MLELSFLNELIQASVFTNFYSIHTELFDNYGKCKYEFRKQDGMVCIFKETGYFFKRMFFFLDKVRLNEKVGLFNDKDLFVSEFVYSESQKDQEKLISNWLIKNNNFHYKTFMRMFKTGIEDYSDVDFAKVQNPSHEDIYEIKNILENNFDILSERIPTIEELVEIKKSTYIIKEDGEIASMLISEIKGKTKELRYWLVLPEYRKKGFGSLLMKYFLNSNKETVRFTLWVDTLNLNAITNYEINGFKKDKLINKIFINRKIMKDKIIKILKDTRPEFEFEENVNFIDEGYLDSFDLITIVSDIESAFDTKISGALIVPESFKSVDSIMNLVQISKNAS
jgi:acyl carrier protein/N-acetylglutamate synthase-like GNAT family acetyltransferase